MKRLFLCLLLAVFMLHNSYAQNKTIDVRNSLYINFLGAAGTLFSINYDRIIHVTKSGYFNVNVGYGYSHMKSFTTPEMGIPLNLNYTHGLNKHHFEIGTGLTYNSGLKQEVQLVHLDEQGHFIEVHSKSEALFLSSRIGYKYQRSEAGIVIRLGFTPLITLHDFSDYEVGDKIIPLFDIGLGFSF